MILIPPAGDVQAALAAAMLNIESGTVAYDPAASAAAEALAPCAEPKPLEMGIESFGMPMTLRVRPRVGWIFVVPFDAAASNALVHRATRRFLSDRTDHLQRPPVVGTGHHFKMHYVDTRKTAAARLRAISHGCIGAEPGEAKFYWNVTSVGDHGASNPPETRVVLSAATIVVVARPPPKMLRPEIVLNPAEVAGLARDPGPALGFPRVEVIKAIVLHPLRAGDSGESRYAVQLMPVKGVGRCGLAWAPHFMATGAVRVAPSDLAVPASPACDFCWTVNIVGWCGAVTTSFGETKFLCTVCASKFNAVRKNNTHVRASLLAVWVPPTAVHEICSGNNFPPDGLWVTDRGTAIVAPTSALEALHPPAVSSWWWNRSSRLSSIKKAVSSAVVLIMSGPPPSEDA